MSPRQSLLDRDDNARRGSGDRDDDEVLLLDSMDSIFDEAESSWSEIFVVTLSRKTRRDENGRLGFFIG